MNSDNYVIVKRLLSNSNSEMAYSFLASNKSVSNYKLDMYSSLYAATYCFVYRDGCLYPFQFIYWPKSTYSLSNKILIDVPQARVLERGRRGRSKVTDTVGMKKRFGESLDSATPVMCRLPQLAQVSWRDRSSQAVVWRGKLALIIDGRCVQGSH